MRLLLGLEWRQSDRVTAQPEPAGMEKFSRANPPRYAVFAGAGQRGLAYAGALHALRAYSGVELGHSVLGAAGTSIGAFFALLVSCGYTADEILRDVVCTPVSQLLSMNLGTLYTHFGMDDGATLQAFVNRLLQAKLGLRQPPTLLQLYERTRRVFVAVATDLSSYSPVYLSSSSHPHMAAAQAVAISMALPPYFCPTQVPAARGGGGQPLLDGGFVDNFPMHLFPAEYTVGFITAQPGGPPPPFALQDAGLHSYLERLFSCAMGASDAAQWDRLPAEVKALRVVTVMTAPPHPAAATTTTEAAAAAAAVQPQHVSAFDIHLTHEQQLEIVNMGTSAHIFARAFTQLVPCPATATATEAAPASSRNTAGLPPPPHTDAHSSRQQPSTTPTTPQPTAATRWGLQRAGQPQQQQRAWDHQPH